MTRTTSAEAYRHNKESGYLTKRQREVLAAFEQYGPMTQTELAERSGIPGAWKRVSELVDSGVLARVGERVNASTGHRAWVWGVTGRGPNEDKLPGIPLKTRQKPRKALIEQIICLEAENAALRAELAAWRGNNSPEAMVKPQFFFTHTQSPAPSPYYTDLDAMRKSLGWRGISGHKRIWTGTHEAPILLDIEHKI